jgi:hypothetical protein
MHKSLRLALFLEIAAFAWSIYDWLFVDEGPHYFAEDHRHILLLLGIVAICTSLLLLYESLSEARKRAVALWLVGSLAVVATVFAVQIVYLMTRMAAIVLGWRFLWIGLPGGFLPCVMAGWLWWLFARILRGGSVSIIQRSQRAGTVLSK